MRLKDFNDFNFEDYTYEVCFRDYPNNFISKFLTQAAWVRRWYIRRTDKITKTQNYLWQCIGYEWCKYYSHSTEEYIVFFGSEQSAINFLKNAFAKYRTFKKPDNVVISSEDLIK
jgi:hypothetical protein